MTRRRPPGTWPSSASSCTSGAWQSCCCAWSCVPSAASRLFTGASPSPGGVLGQRCGHVEAYAWHMPVLPHEAYAWHMPMQCARHLAPVAALLGLQHRPGGAVHGCRGQQGHWGQVCPLPATQCTGAHCCPCMPWRPNLPPTAPKSMICSQCEELREDFNLFVEEGLMTPRLLENMLLLGDNPEMRKYHSFLCSGTTLHGPIALAMVDPQVVAVDFDHVPPCKWHWAVNMASDLVDRVRAQLGGDKSSKKAKEGEGATKEQRRKGKVHPPPHTALQQQQAYARDMPHFGHLWGICLQSHPTSPDDAASCPKYAWHMPRNTLQWQDERSRHMPGIPLAPYWAFMGHMPTITCYIATCSVLPWFPLSPKPNRIPSNVCQCGSKW